MVLLVGVIVAAGVVALGRGHPASATGPSTAQLEADCLGILSTGDVLSGVHLREDARVVAVDRKSGTLLVALAVGAQHVGAYCAGQEKYGLDTGGPMFWRRATGFVVPSRTLGLDVTTYWIHDDCSSRTWMILAHVPLDSTSVKAVSTDVVIDARSVDGFVGILLDQRIAGTHRIGSPIGTSPFGVLIAFDASHVVATTSMRASSVIDQPYNHCTHLAH